MVETLLVANRGEIAVRIIRASREMGIRPVAIYSDADQGALWTRLADAAYRIGAAPARESYLDIGNIIAAAKAAGAGMVHPGYGLLSESAEFAQAVRDAGLIFVGPAPETIALMGDKVTARHAAIASGVPVLPGSDGPVEGLDEALALADGIGWPIAVKASFGGGGRGLRVAHDRAALAGALEQAGREATAAFGRGEVFLERYLVRPRHIEVQILGDSHGNVIHLGDRDCSVQRRHQKLLEEAPAAALPDALRDRIHAAAVKLCRDARYEGAGTVEFLADVAGDAFFFLEMNTRLQVEHGVTEMVTGVDLVKQQIRVARGEALAIVQSDIAVRGHAIQARITAEDPWSGFRPVPGPIERLKLPSGPGLRCDFGVEQGDTVQQHYDSMFGKVQAWGADRDEARARLGLALDQMELAGVPSTAPYLRTLLDQPDFAVSTHDTGSLERDWQPDETTRPAAAEPAPVAAEAGPRLSERQVIVPWGGRSIAVSVFGISVAGTGRAVAQGRSSRTSRASASGGGSAGPEVTSPMDAVVVTVIASPGEPIAKGAPLMMLEAMKMEVAIAAPRDGVVEAIHVSAGAAVRSGAPLATVSA